MARHAELSPARAGGRERILAQFGSMALQSEDLDAVLCKACALVVEELGEGLGKIIEQKSDGKLYLRAFHGFEPTEEQRWIEPGRGSAAGHALVSGTPTLSNDAPNDKRFERAIVVANEDVKSLVNVLIPDPLAICGPWYGVLEVDSPAHRDFSTAEIEFLTLYANLIGAAVVASRGRDRARRLLEEKDRLMAEFQHRVKNNLAVVGSFVRIQSREAGDEEVRRHLDQINMRIETLRLVHERLYANNTTERIAMRAFLTELCESLAAFHDTAHRAIELRIRIEAVEMDADLAIPLGLLVNEFVYNSYKYAFVPSAAPGPVGSIELSLEIVDGITHLRIADDGIGMGDARARKGGTGIRIMEGLAGQLDGTMEWGTGPGTSLELRFPVT